MQNTNRPALQDLNTRFVNAQFQGKWVIINSRKSGNCHSMWMTDEPEWARQRLAWAIMLNPNIKPTEIYSFTLSDAAETMRDIRDESDRLAHAEMARTYGWRNPAKSKPFELDEDWVSEYYDRYRPIRLRVQSQLIQEVAA
tara:strand:+ start:90 stop:512 length:423 start_codon:yes stop_codon:yes gene_type:complete